MSILISLAQRMIFIVIHLILLLNQKFLIICIPGCGIPCRLTLSLSLVSPFKKKYLRLTYPQISYSFKQKVLLFLLLILLLLFSFLSFLLSTISLLIILSP